ncbi:MAG: NtaA/DmoA family FMN-dependent monooxygenase, partial [Rhodospirillaceae bacterium]|nr:NtaA/DmoA family FMN-dependent monooxygenase [Rhodospirillaceae bacterium]
SHHNPFYAARLWATLDHLTKGRAAWNVVTSLNHNQAANYGEERADTDSRYDRAHEFVEVCQKLWQSWDEDAVVMDRENAIFADANKVHRIEHQGEFFKSRGPLNVVRSRHGGPPIIQAGTSPKGMDLAAKYADAIFAIQPRVENAAEYYTAVKGRMEGFGRRPEDCKILFGMQPIIGASEAEAVEKQELHNSLMPLDGGMTILSSHMDFDLSKLDPNEKIAERTEPELQRMHSRFLKPSGESMTVAEVAQRHGEGVSLPQFVGTPEAIVDQMEAYIDVVGGDGFMISPIYCPGAIEEFVDQVVPELQRRGLFRTDYAGTTQRDHLGQYD